MCQLVASGPVSDSPSPTTAATIRSGLSNAAPQACDRHVAEFAAFVDGAGRLRGAVAADPAGEGELLEQPRHPPRPQSSPDRPRSTTLRGSTARARPGPPCPGPAMKITSRSCCLDRPVQMDVAEGQPGAGPPVAEQPVLDVLRLERLLQERVGLEVRHPQREVVARPPEGVDLRSSSGLSGDPETVARAFPNALTPSMIFHSHSSSSVAPCDMKDCCSA